MLQYNTSHNFQAQSALLCCTAPNLHLTAISVGLTQTAHTTFIGHVDTSSI